MNTPSHDAHPAGRTSRWAPVALALVLIVTASGAEQANQKDKDQEQSPPPMALELGEYSLREVRGAEGEKLRVEFVLYASVDPKFYDQIKTLHKKLKHRVREQVLIAARMCETKDFLEPGLERLKRRIMLRMKRTLPLMRFEALHLYDYSYFSD